MTLVARVMPNGRLAADRGRERGAAVRRRFGVRCGACDVTARFGPFSWPEVDRCRARYVCDQCGHVREFAVPRRTPVRCKYDDSQMGEVKS